MEFRFVDDGMCVILYVVGFWSFFLFKKLTFIYNIVLMEFSFVYDGICVNLTLIDFLKIIICKCPT